MKTDNKIGDYSFSELLKNDSNGHMPNMTEILKKLNRIEDVDSICSFVCDNVKKIIDQGYVIVTFIEADETTLVLKSMKGFEDSGLINSAIRILGRDPRGTKTTIKDMAEDELASFQSGRLELLPGGMYSLLARKYPKAVCTVLEKLLKINFIYTIGFTHHSRHLGGVTILLDSKTAIEKNASIIETLVNQAAIYLSRKKTEKELQENVEKYRTLVEKVNEAILIVQDGIFVFANSKTFEIMGMVEEDFVGKSFMDFVWPEDREMVAANYAKRITGETFDGNYDFRIIGTGGSPVWVFMSVALIQYKDRPATLLMITDITERKKSEQEILRLSFHDQLTELYNRRFFEEELKRLDTKRQLPLSFIMGDLNGLKLINDVFGHTEGDSLLVKTAEILKKVCRFDDMLARWGGDEFVLLLPKTSAQDSEEIVARIKKGCRKTASQKIPLSLSLGTATKEISVQNVQAIIIDAESNMYRNKLAQKESISSSVIFALEQALCEKSNETKEHIDKVRDLALRLGKSVRLNASQLDEISLLASLHDIGKVAIAETILTKEGKLTKKEWDVVKRHPEIGFNIASSSPQIAHIAKAILACHENFDGSGYPLGIAGESIPIISRIILISDAYDVMTRGRLYKDPMSRADEIKELKRCSGVQFDPVLVEKFIEIISK